MNFKVVKIIDEYLIVVNYGKSQNAQKGDELEIFDIGERVFDPETNEDLGTLDLYKGKITVVNVYDKISLCKSAERLPKPGSINSSISTLFLGTFNNYEIKALNVNTKQISGGYNEDNDLIINLGDPVQIVKSKYQEELKKKEDEEEF